jgi:hypothetical protein
VLSRRCARLVQRPNYFVLTTLAAGFEAGVLQDAATQITDAFSGLF